MGKDQFKYFLIVLTIYYLTCRVGRIALRHFSCVFEKRQQYLLAFPKEVEVSRSRYGLTVDHRRKYNFDVFLRVKRINHKRKIKKVHWKSLDFRSKAILYI